METMDSDFGNCSFAMKFVVKTTRVRDRIKIADDDSSQNRKVRAKFTV